MTGLLMILKLLTLIQFASCINISPVPNIIFKIPDKHAELSTNRSTYFGFSVVLRSQSVLVGAPRSNSLLDDQKELNEPGVVFKCDLETRLCHDFNFDAEGNEGFRKNTSNGTLHFKQKKESQMLGSVMSGGPSESDPLVVCAPNFREVECGEKKCSNETEHYYHGICYSTNETVSNQPTKVRTLSPLEDPEKQMLGILRIYRDGMVGFSCHVNEEKEIVLGAPGVYQQRGNLFSYQHENVKPHALDYTKNDKTDNQNYFGFAVSSGYFRGKEKNRKNQISHVASVPRRISINSKTLKASPKNGMVVIFEMRKTKEALKPMRSNVMVVSGLQFGEYFGYSLLTEDFNNDGFDDLAVSAPLHSVDESMDNGAVYVFINKKNNKKVSQLTAFGCCLSHNSIGFMFPAELPRPHSPQI
jgi:hypothetical protein